jgi:hypothetical protein
LSYARNNGVYERKVTNEMVKSISRVQSGAGSQIQAPTIQERVLAIAVGAEVEVQLDDKTGLQGRMGDASAEGFTLEPATGGERRVLSFSGVTSIKSVEHSKPPTLKGVLIGIGVGFVLLVALAAKVGD